MPFILNLFNLCIHSFFFFQPSPRNYVIKREAANSIPFSAVDYFAKTNFSGGIEVLVVQIQDQIRDEFGMGNEHGHHPNFFRVYTLNGQLVSFICLLANNFRV